MALNTWQRHWEKEAEKQREGLPKEYRDDWDELVKATERNH
jgi:hypothetical protein